MLAVQMCRTMSPKHQMTLIKYLHSDRYKYRRDDEETRRYTTDDMFISDHSFWGDSKMDELTRYAMFETADSLLKLKIAKNGKTKQDGEGPIRL